MIKLWLNAVGFQAGWWACITSVSRGLEIEAIVFCLILCIVHLYFSDSRLAEIKLAGLALVVGILLDSSLQYLAGIHFHGLALAPLSPFWLWMLWAMFGLTLNASFAFLKRLPYSVSALAGLVFGPLNYYAGSQLGAADFEPLVVRSLCLPVAWMLAMPLLVFAAQHLSHTSKDET